MAKPLRKKTVPYEFILEELSALDLHTKPMFGCTGIYVGDKIMLILRKKEKMDEDTGVWVCIPDESILEMKSKFPFLRGVSFFENPNSPWQVLHESHVEFEEMCFEFCKMIKKHSPYIGRLPKPKKLKTKKKVVRLEKRIKTKS